MGISFFFTRCPGTKFMSKTTQNKGEGGEGKQKNIQKFEFYLKIFFLIDYIFVYTKRFDSSLFI